MKRSILSLILSFTFGNEQMYKLPDSLSGSPHCTVLSLEQCNDAVVKNVLIDKRGIEKTALFVDESTMVKVMKNSVLGTAHGGAQRYLQLKVRTGEQAGFQDQRNCSLE